MSKIVHQGNLRGDKVRYDTKTWCCVWYPMGETDEDIGVCFDFHAEDLDDMITLLQTLRAMDADDGAE